MDATTRGGKRVPELDEELGEDTLEGDGKMKKAGKRRASTSSVVVSHRSCQVEGCNADMAGAKPYHRRHRVCEFHAKATVVLVAGIHQRFCQQCSRFHELSEFDEAKRSCRRRLAGHNERRRKSYYGSH